MKFNLKYFIAFALLLTIEILIAIYGKGFIRHTFGDYLVVILLYAFFKSFLKTATNKVAFITLLISYFVEFLQLTNLKNMYPNQYLKTFQILLGTSFSFWDLLAYTLGYLSILILEKKISFSS